MSWHGRLWHACLYALVPWGTKFKGWVTGWVDVCAPNGNGMVKIASFRFWRMNFKLSSYTSGSLGNLSGHRWILRRKRHGLSCLRILHCKGGASSSSFRLAHLHVWPGALTKRLRLLWLTLDKRICLQGYNNHHSHMWTKPTRVLHVKSLRHPLSCLLITLPSAGRQRAPYNAKLAEVGTPSITGQQT